MCSLCSDDAKRKKVKFDIERNYVKVFERKCVSVFLWFAYLVDSLSVTVACCKYTQTHWNIASERAIER